MTVAEKTFAVGDRVYYRDNGKTDAGTVKAIVQTIGKNLKTIERYIIDWDEKSNDISDNDEYTANQIGMVSRMSKFYASEAF